MFSSICSGILKDFRRRIPLYWSDWVDIRSRKVLSASFFIFFTSLTPSITFALLLASSTSNQLGTLEVLFSTALCGCTYAILAGQPLVIVGVTGPVVILSASIYKLSVIFNLDFLVFYSWSQFWAALFLFLLAITNTCDMVEVVTRFSCDVFGFLIALIYLYTGIEGIVKMFYNDDFPSYSLSLLQTILALGTFLSAHQLSKASNNWIIGNANFRTFISDYSTTIAVVIWTIIPILIDNSTSDDIPTIFLPSKFARSINRTWIIDFSHISIQGIFFAIIPGIVIAILFYFDHNVSSLMSQSTDKKLVKGTAFHYDFLILALITLLTGILALPPANGLIPQAPLHVKALTKFSMNSETGEKITKVREQRWSNFLQSLFCFLTIIYPFSWLLKLIPTAVLYGLFIHLGFASLEDNELFSRSMLLIMDSHLLSQNHFYRHHNSILSMSQVSKFTILQLICGGIIFGITFTDAAVIFPILILFLIIIRLYLMKYLFTEEDLIYLDSPMIIPDANIEANSEESFQEIDHQSEKTLISHHNQGHQNSDETFIQQNQLESFQIIIENDK